jgi:outer membrane protein OmpA-like peptidoglycan-associated protein
MKSKKYALFLTTCMSIATLSVSAQMVPGGSYDIFDSSLIPSSRMPQHSKFLNHDYSYPSKPRNMWEVGVKAGILTVSGDVPAVVPTFGFGAHVRKSLGYTVSVKLEYINGVGKGMHWLSHDNYQKNTPWVRAGYVPARQLAGSAVTFPAGGTPILGSGIGSGAPGTGNTVVYLPAQDVIYDNYRTKIQDLSLFGVVTLNNIRFHKRQSGITIYGEAGVGASVYDTKVNALGSNGQRYNFNSIAAGTHKSRRDVWKAIKDLPNWDNTYESDADNHGARRPKLLGGTLKPSGTVGMGIAFRLNNRINIALEDRWTFIKEDLLDGYRWQVNPTGDATMTRDFDSYNMLTLGLNVNLGSKSTQPLYWENPLDYVYNEMRDPKYLKPKPQPCDDADKDGVCDYLDEEANTPAGCGVDTHGKTRDTDGDGVPDCKDNELITPTACQKEVSADGVGKCPDPECCKNIPSDSGIMNSCTEKLGGGMALAFGEGSCKLSSDVKSQLDVLAQKMKASPDCNIKLSAGADVSKAAKRNADCRNNAIVNYLVNQKGIAKDRIEYEINESGDMQTVDVIGL